MKPHWLRAAALVAALALAGCNRATVDTDGAPEDTDTRLGETIPIDLAAWLKEPRADLAKRADEYAKAIEQQQEGVRNQPTTEMLLPRLAPPHTAPVLASATFSARAGFSLPDYLKAGQRDPAVALHLARYGDHEAALKLADPADAALRKAIASHRASKNYPVEWTRLVGLVLISAQYKVSLGDVEGATELAVLHQQLGQVLDPQAAAGPLGWTLLTAGRRALALAAPAWRAPRWNKTALADDIDKALAAWGSPPLGRPGLAIGANKAEATALFGVAARGKAVLAVAAELPRALDLLDLPLPRVGVESVTAFLSSDDRVAGLAVAYRGKLDSAYPETDHLAYHLDERGLKAREDAKEGGHLSDHTLAVGDLNYRFTRCTRTAGLGALVRIDAVKGGPVAAHEREPRGFGPVHLDRGFETNRVAVAPDKAGPLVLLDNKTTLQDLVKGAELPTPTLAVLQRDKASDLVQSLRLSWSIDQGNNVASGLLPTLFAYLGPTGAKGVESSTGAHLRFRWQDERTRVELQLPYDDKPPMLVIEDVQPASRAPERLRLARERDESERRQRLQEGKPQVRLARNPGAVNDFSLEKLSLGQPRTEAQAALPQGKHYRVKEVPGGLSLLDLHPPTPGQPYWAAQVLVRFDEKDQVSEIRVRYREGLAPGKKSQALPARLIEARAGVPETLPSTWAGLWPDLPAYTPRPALYRWQDDLTVRTCERDAGGSEIVWRDRSGKDEAHPWRFLGQGPAGCALGNTRESVEAALRAPATSAGGASVYHQPAKSPYESIQVWFAGGKVSRIVAIHRGRTGTQPAEVAGALRQGWGRDIDALGALRRQEGRRGALLGSYFWHDDRTRVQLLVRLDGDNGRVMTEWREWPLAPGK